MSLADPIRKIGARIIGKYSFQTDEEITERFFKGECYTQFKNEKIQMTGVQLQGSRPLLEAIGEGVCEFLGNGIWVSSLINKIKNMSEENPDIRIIVDDVRKPFEAEALNMIGGLGIFLDKPGSDGSVVTEVCQKNVDKGLIVPAVTIPFDHGIHRTQEIIESFIDD
jgi:hypothetical protein